MINEKDFPIKYVYVSCPKCGRKRLELWSNGNLICEKCSWNETEKRYEVKNY